MSRYSEQESLHSLDEVSLHHTSTMAESTSAASAPLPSTAGSSASAKPRQPIWLRCEKKEHERRSALTPSTAKTLMDNGVEVFVERDTQRIFDDKEFEA